MPIRSARYVPYSLFGWGKPCGGFLVWDHVQIGIYWRGGVYSVQFNVINQ